MPVNKIQWAIHPARLGNYRDYRKEKIMMGRDEAKKWLSVLHNLLSDVSTDVSCLLPIVTDFKKNVMSQLDDAVKVATKAKHLLERLK